MYKLFYSDLSRLIRLKIFRIVTVMAVLANIFNVALNCLAEPGYDYSFQLKYICIGVLAESTLVIGNLIGSDYSQSTIRYKIVAGYSRFEIFMSNWLTSFLCINFYTAGTFLVICGSGTLFGSEYPYSYEKTLSIAVLCLLLCAVLASFFTAWYMIVSSQSAAITVSLIVILIGTVLGAGILASLVSVGDLEQSGYTDEHQTLIVSEQGVYTQDDPGRYTYQEIVSGKQTLVKLVFIVLPGSHFLGIQKEFRNANLAAMVAEIVIFFLIGYLVFRKRDIK